MKKMGLSGKLMIRIVCNIIGLEEIELNVIGLNRDGWELNWI